MNDICVSPAFVYGSHMMFCSQTIVSSDLLQIHTVAVNHIFVVFSGLRVNGYRAGGSMPSAYGKTYAPIGAPWGINKT